MAADVAEQIIGALQRRVPRAALVSEVAATLRPTPPAPELEAALQSLGEQGKVLIAEHAAPDVHLETADLRVVAVVTPETDESAALEAAEAYWNGLLRMFLTTHRCQ